MYKFILSYLLVQKILLFQHTNAQNAWVFGNSNLSKSFYLSIQNEIGENFTQEIKINSVNIINLESPQMIYVGTSNSGKLNFYQFILFPGDSVEITQHFDSFEFKGKFQNEYTFLHELEERGLGIYGTPENDCKICPQRYLELFNKRVEFINKYSDSLGFRSQFKELVNNLFKIKHIWGWLQIYSFVTKEPDHYDIGSSYFDSLANFKKKLVFSPKEISKVYYVTYSNTLKTYNRFLTEKNYRIIPNFDNQFISAMINFEGYQRDLLLTRLLKDGFKNNDVKPEHISKFFEICKTQKYIEFVKDLMKKRINSSPVLLDTAKVFLQNDTYYSWQDIAKNKYTYIDFWASWCGPCLKEFEKSAELEKEYSKKGVSFSFISIDKDSNAWIKAQKKHQIPPKRSYLFPNYENCLLSKQIELLSVPRYIIVDDKGTIVNSDAPRPSDPLIREIFDKLLKN
ncbi:MAG: redoxin family protein [Spirosomaceae bacterium]|jgi:thiol-disulfide isomerase/thioredoxin|nr:redoxin family protein [Spirosomataceae bacterium]